MPGRGFIIFWIFLLFFSEFSFPDRLWTVFWSKIFVFTFLAYLVPFWLKIMPERGFLIFWIFLLFFGNFLPRVEYERNSGLKVFLAFSAYLIPFWLKIMPEIVFLIFWFFFQFFSGFSCPGRVWTKFGTKSFFSLSQPFSTSFR